MLTARASTLLALTLVGGAHAATAQILLHEIPNHLGGNGVESEKPGEFLKCPHGAWLDSKGDLYVSEVQADARLQKFVRQR